MALAQATKSMADRYLCGLVQDLEGKVRDTFPFTLESILLGAYPEFAPIVREIRGYPEPERDLWHSWSGSLPVALLAPKSWPQPRMLFGGAGPVIVAPEVVRIGGGIEPARHDSTRYTFGTALRMKVSKLRDDPWLPQLRFTGYGLPSIASRELKDHVRVAPDHPLYDEMVRWADVAIPRLRQVDRARVAISFLIAHANSAGHYQRMVPDLVPLLPERIQRGIGEAKRASPLPRSVKLLRTEEQELGLKLCAELATTLSIAMLNPRDADKAEETCRLAAFDTDWVNRAVLFERTR